MPTWTEEQLAIIQALQDSVDDANNDATTANKRAAAANAVAKAVENNLAKNSALDDSRFNAIYSKVEEAEQKATEAKAIAEKALTEATEYEAKSDERYAQTQKLIAHLDSMIEDNKDCCQSNMKAIERCLTLIKVLEQFVQDINDHEHEDDLQAGDKLISDVIRRKDNASVDNNRKARRTLSTAKFGIEGSGKLKHIVEAIETWISPYLHKHEAATDAADKAAQELCDKRNVLMNEQRQEILAYIDELQKVLTELNPKLTEDGLSITNIMNTNSELLYYMNLWKIATNDCDNTSALVNYSKMQDIIRAYQAIGNNPKFTTDGTEGAATLKATLIKLLVRLGQIVGISSGLS